MKSTAMVLALAMGLAPAFAMADQTNPNTAPSQVPEPGGTSIDGLPIFQLGSQPMGTIVVGGLVVLTATGLVVGIIGIGDDASTVATSTSTN